MKKLILLASLFVSSLAFADQCQIVDAEVAARAKLLIKNNSEVILHCKPCGDKVSQSKIHVVRSFKTQGGEFLLNNDKKLIVDLAYTYVKVAPNMFVNVAKVTGCPASDVPNEISK